MPDYSKGQIYTIRFIDDIKTIYIGSTCQSLAKRFGGHKITVSGLYKHIQETYDNDWSKCYIELYESFKCDNKNELTKREGEIIRQFINNKDYNVLNQRIEGRTQKEYVKEYYEDNKEKIKEYDKEYYEDNKEYKKEYYEKKKIK